METRDQRLKLLLLNAQKEWGDKYLIIAVPRFVGRKFVAYCSIKEDLELMLAYINELRDEPSRIARSALTYALISLYGKCFTDATESSSPKLEAKVIFMHDNPNLKIHKNLMHMRHNFIAHRGDTDSEIGIAFLAHPKEGNEKPQVRFAQLKQISFSVDDIVAIEKLLKFLLNFVIGKIQTVGQNVNNGMFNLFSPEQLAFMLFNNTNFETEENS